MLDERAEPLDGRTIVLDCRWLGIGGAGRVTELLLAGLHAAPPSGTWLLWGDPGRIEQAVGPGHPAAPGAHLFPGARIVPWRGDPTRLLGQRDLLRVPRGDVVVYLHQVRPLRPGPSVTVIHDTIPLRYGGGRPVRALKGLFLRVAARLSDRVVTVSESAREAIVRDLGVRPSRVTVTTLGVDSGRIERIRSLRAASPRADFVLFVGRFAPHKNLRRLCRAFATTGLAADGGRLLLVGGTPSETVELAAWARDEGLACVDVRAACPEAELDRLLASCRVLVQPSLEEGYGLPAVEAAAVGVQVAASPTGAASAIPSDRLTLMDPRDETSIAMAIDAAATRRDPTADWTPVPTVSADVSGAVAAVVGRA